MNGLTPHQTIFTALCKKMDIPQEQTAICLCIFSDKELKEILDWFVDESRKQGEFLKDVDLLRKIGEMVRQGKYLKTDNK